MRRGVATVEVESQVCYSRLDLLTDNLLCFCRQNVMYLQTMTMCCVLTDEVVAIDKQGVHVCIDKVLCIDRKGILY